MQTPKTNRGFIGFVTLMIGVVIVAYLMMMQYKKIGMTEQKAVTGAHDSSEVEFVSDTAVDVESVRSPIDRANGIKDILESQDQRNFNQ